MKKNKLEEAICKCGHKYYAGLCFCPMCKIDKEDRQEKIDRLKAEAKIRCVHVVRDGAGIYCGLKPMTGDYPHKFMRTDCYGIKSMCRFPELYIEKEKFIQ